VSQTLPQLPQCAAEVLTFTQPSAPQAVKPLSQAAPHFPPAQVRAPFSTAGHSSAQPPQFSGSPEVSMHVTSHKVLLEPQVKSHAPWAQVAVPATGALHSAWHAPQFFGSFAASTSQPFTTFPSQSRLPSLQVLVQVPP